MSSLITKNLQNSIGKVICVGRNYSEHAKELGNDVPEQPLLFMKPASAVVSVHDIMQLPNTQKYNSTTHFETELCVQIGKDLYDASIDEVKFAISGVTLGLDLTLRAVQNELKEKGHPWERAKAFAGSCVLADWISPESFADFTQVHYEFYLNDECRQVGETANMLFPVYELLLDISHAFGLQSGDVVMTGTPKGVGELSSGDNYKLKLGKYEWQGSVA